MSLISQINGFGISPDEVSTFLKAHPSGSIYISLNSTSPADLYGGTWEGVDSPYELAGTYNLTTNGYINCTSGVEKTLLTATIPAGAIAQITGFVDSSVGDDSSITYAKLLIPNIVERVCRTTMSNGGGCEVSLLYDNSTSTTALTIQLITYNYRSTTTSFKGAISGVYFKKNTELYRWKRIT